MAPVTHLLSCVTFYPFQLLLGAWREVKGEVLAGNGADWGQHNCVDG